MASWETDAIVLNAIKYGENDAILEVFSYDYGRVSAYVYGGAGKRKRAFLQPGQILHLGFIAKGENNLGYFDRLETKYSIENVFDNVAGINAIGSVCALLKEALPNAQIYKSLFNATEILIQLICNEDDWAAAYVRWEVGLLADCGFGMDLDECALSGGHENLAWVSPKTGRAACYEAGLPYKDKLLVLPPFLVSSENEIKSGDIADGFALTGWFIERDLLGQAMKNIPDARSRLIIALCKKGKL
jgi:DNA repair protein RecO (recombination protein O)